MKVAIVEDMEIHQNNLKECLLACGSKHSIDIEIDIYQDGIEIIDKKDLDYDIIYLDIRMNFVDGMETAKEIRNRDNEVLIVFCTNYIQYAIDGYSVNATDFLLKPVQEFAFSQHFKKILARINKSDEPFVLVKTKQGYRKVKHSSILYMESEGHYINIYCKEEKISFLESLKSMEQILENQGFYRCNSCYIINLEYVKEVKNSTVMVGEYELQVSRGRKKSFLEALTNYVGDKV